MQTPRSILVLIVASAGIAWPRALPAQESELPNPSLVVAGAYGRFGGLTLPLEADTLGGETTHGALGIGAHAILVGGDLGVWLDGSVGLAVFDQHGVLDLAGGGRILIGTRKLCKQWREISRSAPSGGVYTVTYEFAGKVGCLGEVTFAAGAETLVVGDRRVTVAELGIAAIREDLSVYFQGAGFPEEDGFTWGAVVGIAGRRKPSRRTTDGATLVVGVLELGGGGSYVWLGLTYGLAIAPGDGS